jgi:hypothetical protein
MKTTIQRVKHIEFTEQEKKILKEFEIEGLKDSDFDDIYSQEIINLLIEINPEKQEHKDFIMELIKELKR